MNPPERRSPAAGWNTFWDGTGTTAAFSSAGVEHPAVDTFWSSFFAGSAARAGGNSLLDVATGNGAIVERVLADSTTGKWTVTCVDKSRVAIDSVCRRFPQVRGMVADAGRLPFANAGFDTVTSQFGVEYAGKSAIHEAARVVASGGSLAMLLHIRGSSIHKECSDSLRALSTLQQAQFLPLARHFFTAGFAAVRGGNRADYDAAGRRFATAVRAAEQVISTFGEGVAGGFVAWLYREVSRIHERIQYHDPDEVMAWIDTVDAEVHAYTARMSAMVAAAIDGPGFEQIVGHLRANGFDLKTAENLSPGNGELPLAWAVTALRRA